MDGADDDQLARRALRRMVAELADELHFAIDDGLDAERLQDIVALWEVNHEEITFASLVKLGAPNACADCATDISPYDEEGRPVQGGWEWYMVRREVWEAAAGDGVRFLCIDCLERRLERRLTPDDFSDAPLNAFLSGLESERLRDRLGL